MEKIDYTDPACPFDTSYYVKEKKVAPSSVDVKGILLRYDELIAVQEYTKAERWLEDSLKEAVDREDKAGELGILSELIGTYRKSGEEEKGIEAVYRALDLINELGIEGTATAGTVWLNCATTLREFRRFEDALPYFYMASRAYSNTIPADDYRFASLYNNLASCLDALGRDEEALKYYKAALSIVKDNTLTPIEAAITYVNIAELYDKIDSSSSEIENCINKCMEIFADPDVPRDEYYSYHAKSCARGIDRLGFFKDARELYRRAKAVDDEIS